MNEQNTAQRMFNLQAR